MSKKRDREYGPKPQYVELKRENIAKSSAQLPHGYCKKGKAMHVFELDSSIDYSQGWCMKTYHCVICNKKKRILKIREMQEEGKQG